ncbi:hypothetical protein H5410_064558 [Solanum commersonii]|uniref:C2 domain-containing protein n=1 Tax=Solanum commersonii TaxID=4109 RepID=A0A9J5VZ47_SOLCO|nr:hypothetical protein H5410_064558 [Solanum commersonii]
MAYCYNPSFFFLLFVTLFLTSDYVIQSTAISLEITLPELPKPELPHLPEIPTLPKLEFPEIPKPELPTLPKPELPKIPKPELPTLPKLKIPVIPKPELPTLPKLEIPQMLELVKIRVHRGINLPLKDTFHSDPYVVTMGDQTSCKKNNCNPVWDDELTLALKNPNVQIVLTVYDKDTFSKDDKIGEEKIDIKPYLKALEMSYHQDLPNGVKVDKVQPNRDNCLAKESCIIWENGKLIQDMTLMLQNVECGEVKLQTEVIPKMLSEDAFYFA